jgi:hypothetical protein
MSHQEEMVARIDELTDAVQVVAETLPHIKADHRPHGSDWYRWLIWNDQTSERHGVVALGGPEEYALSLVASDAESSISRISSSLLSRMSSACTRNVLSSENGMVDLGKKKRRYAVGSDG